PTVSLMSDKSSSHSGFPQGLVSAFIAWRLPAKEVKLADLLAALARMPGGGAKKTWAHVLLKGERGYHADFEVRRDGNWHVWVELELVAGGITEEAESLHTMFEAIRPQIKKEPRHDAKVEGL